MNTNKLRKISEEELREILKLHKMWLNWEDGGKKADLSYADLVGVDLSGTNLSGTNLSYADLSYADLSGTNLSYANLIYADLSYADLSYADLSGTNLVGVDLSGTNLSYADLINTDLRDITKNYGTLFYSLQCPEEGSFIGYKKADYKIVVLEISADAKRSSATTRKCRCSKAKVLRIEDLEGNVLDIDSVNSNYDKNFVYKVGEIVEVKDFDDDRWNECSTGIHFFITKQEAVSYKG